jgi:hypothetical protein
MDLSKFIVAAALAVSFGTAFGQAKEIRIAHVYDKTGPLEAYAKQTHAGLMMGLEYATGGKMEVLGRKIVVIEKDSQLKPDAGKAQLAAAYGDDKVDLASPRSTRRSCWSSRRWRTRSRARTGIATSSAPGAAPRRTQSPTPSRSARRTP